MGPNVSEHRAPLEGLVELLEPLECAIDALSYGIGHEGVPPFADARPGAVWPGRSAPPVVAGSAGFVLAREVVARLSVPLSINSVMDGFAVHHASVVRVPTTLPVCGDVATGDIRKRTLKPGTATRTVTGMAVSDGADTVAKVEDTDHVPDVSEAPPAMMTRTAQAPAANVHFRGEDFDAGAPVLSMGVVLSPTAVSAAVSVGCGTLFARPRPRIGILTPGSGLVAPGEELAEDRIPNPNGAPLAGLAVQAGGDVIARWRSADDPEVLFAILASVPEIDLLVTAGGIPAGACETAWQALSGPTMRFHHVAQWPGRPQGAGTALVGGRPVSVACLPGNPVSVYVSSHMHVAGMTRVLVGRSSTAEPTVRQAVTDGEWASPRGKVQFISLRLDGGHAFPIHELGSRSHLVASLSSADGLGVVPADVERVMPGDTLGSIPTEGSIND